MPTNSRFTWTIFELHKEHKEMKPKQFSKREWNKQALRCTALENSSEIRQWQHLCLGAVFLWCFSPTLHPHPTWVSSVNQKMKTRPSDPKEMKRVCFAHYVSLTPRRVVFPVPCVWSWELGTDGSLKSQGEAKFSLKCELSGTRDTQRALAILKYDIRARRRESRCAFTNSLLSGWDGGWRPAECLGGFP